MDGLINFHKPTGITSAKALYKVRAITRQRKSGHTGTLDPMASGVLVLCLGRGTKLVERVMDQPKVYLAEARLDRISDTFDEDGETRPVAVESPPSAACVREVLASFEGVYEQVPPAFSAVKVGGTPAYKLARRRREVRLEPRPVRVYWVHLHDYEYPRLTVEVCCGRGTYVRALIRDWADRLGTGGCLTSLTRTRVGPFAIEEAWRLEDLEQQPDPEAWLIPLERARAMLREPFVPPRPG